MVSLQGIEKLKPYLSQITVQAAFAGVYIFVRMALIDGMNPFVYVTYRLVIATLVVAPFAYLLEKKKRPPLTWSVFFPIFLLGTGIAITQNCYVPALYYTSSTFIAAAFNVVPVLTFVMAAFLRQERVNIRSLRGQAKIVGTVICVAGAMVMVLYKGPTLQILSPGVKSHKITSESNRNVLLGSILAFGGVVVWSACIALQPPVLKMYPAHLSLTALTSLVGAVESAIIAVICAHKKSNFWVLGWNIELLSMVYSGIIGSALVIFLIAWCISKKGPLFVAIFGPASTIVTAILELIILHVNLRLGSVMGAILIVVGVYFTLWGKAKDVKAPYDGQESNSVSCDGNGMVKDTDIEKDTTLPEIPL